MQWNMKIITLVIIGVLMALFYKKIMHFSFQYNRATAGPPGKDPILVRIENLDALVTLLSGQTA